MRRLRVGVVGCGLIAQVMHLPHLLELRDRFDLVALCDLSPGTLSDVGNYYGVSERYARWEDLVAQDLDAVLILSPGSHHAPPAIAAARSGKHVFVEKPMCVTRREADDMIAAADRAGVVLAVGNNKRYDPAYQRARILVQGVRDLRLGRITTLEAPLAPYVKHHRLVRYPDVPSDTLAALSEDSARLIGEALGQEAPASIRKLYAEVLLDSLVHEVNALRGLLGEPEAVTSADLWMDAEGVNAVLRYPGDLRCVLTWINLPDLRHYSQELAFYGPADRLALRFPSPFLRNEPTMILLEGMDDGEAWEKRITVSYEESFKRELEHFYDCVVNGETPATTGRDGRQDILVLQAIARAAMTGQPQVI